MSESTNSDNTISLAPPQRRAQDFLELVQRSKRGRLKLYVGFAAGVGKTYRMLEEAHALGKRGTDIVIGYVETHDRAETAALIEGLEVVPRKQIVYRGLTVEEMDLDAVLARHPEIAIVDELPHTNVPGCRHGKRYEDVLELLDAGINVIGAFNVQHLESLKDVVERITGITVRETIPDTFLKQADQVVNLDLATEDLLDRLQSGKIYAPHKVTTALANFFQADNLSTLRELALREVAESAEGGAAYDQCGEATTTAYDDPEGDGVGRGSRAAQGRRSGASTRQFCQVSWRRLHRHRAVSCAILEATVAMGAHGSDGRCRRRVRFTHRFPR
jgi:two-component system sensor histidine kinase KdpD